MRDFFILFGTILLLATACGEGENFETEVEKTVEIEFEFSTNGIRNNDGLIKFEKPYDIIATDFEEYVGNIKDVDVNSAEILISGADETALPQAFIRLIDLKISSLGTDMLTLDFFRLENLPIKNSDLIFVYNKDSVQSQQVESAVNFIGNRALSGESFLWGIEGNVEDVPADEVLIVKVFITVVIEVELL